MAEADLNTASSEGSYVGSMGLHQNNLLPSQAEQSPSSQGQFSTSGFNINQFVNRSMIDVFRDIRDRYFGKPGINVNPRKESTNQLSEGIFELEEVKNSESLESLPIYCKLMVLSFLDTKDVCSVSCLNSSWREIANDQVLWRELLIRDMCKWDSLSNKSHPLISQVWDNDAFMKSNSEFDFFEVLQLVSDDVPAEQNTASLRRDKGINFKALYIHSSFQRAQDDMDITSSRVGIPGFIKSLWQGNDPHSQGEIIITGPGMDSPRTSKLFQSLMWGNKFLETKGLLPGNRDGIGSGVQVIFKEKIQFNLVALYSANNRIRETRLGMERLLNSNVVQVIQNGDGSEQEDGDIDRDNDPQFALHDAVRFYIAERKGNYKLVYVVDATADQKWEDISCIKLELSAILKGTEFDSNVAAAIGHDIDQNVVGLDGEAVENHRPPNLETNMDQAFGKRPLLVLSCVKDDSVPRLSCMQVTAMLGLPNVTDRQWRVQDVVISNMYGVEKGLEWLLRQS